MFLDGFLELLDGILRELDFFVDLLGLKINFFKIKFVWIGSKKFLKEVFYYLRWKLEWGNNIFDLLGIKFFINFIEMIDLNYNLIF